MSDILTKNVRQSPVLIITIISKYRCKRCHQVFNRISKVATDLKVGMQDDETKSVCNATVSALEKISASRDSQMHFCGRDKDDGGFTNRIDVIDYIKYKIDNKESVEVGPAEYLGSNIIKDKLSIDIDSNELDEKANMNFGECYISDPNTNLEEG